MFFGGCRMSSVLYILRWVVCGFRGAANKCALITRGQGQNYWRYPMERIGTKEGRPGAICGAVPGGGWGTDVSERRRGTKEPMELEGQAIGFGEEVIVGDHSVIEALRHDPVSVDCRWMGRAVWVHHVVVNFNGERVGGVERHQQTEDRHRELVTEEEPVWRGHLMRIGWRNGHSGEREIISIKKEEGPSRKLMEQIFEVARADGIENMVKTFLGKKEQSLFFRDKWEGIRNWSCYRWEGEVGQGHLYLLFFISQKKRGEVRSHWQHKIQPSLERDSGRETIRLCRKGRFQIYTFSCPKQRTPEMIECSIWRVP